MISRNTQIKYLFFILLCTTAILISCKKKSKPEDITFEYTYPDIQFTIGDSASYGSTIEGWTYLALQKMSNTGFFQLLRDKSVYSEDVTSVILKSCTLKITSGDSSFNTFDSLHVKIGGTFSFQGNVYVSAASDMQIASLSPVPKTSAFTLELTPSAENCNEQIRVDPDIAFRAKLYSKGINNYYLPNRNITASLTFSVAATTH